MMKQTLHGPTIQLTRFDDSMHREKLTHIAQAPELWTYQCPKNMALSDYVDHYIDQLATSNEDGTRIAYVVADTQSHKILGSSRYYDISQTDKSCCIGFTWYTPNRWGSGINEAVKYLMLSQILDDFGWNRVGFHVDSRNARSIAAMQKIGAVKEGLLRQHKIVQGDFVRDTVQFSITREDWPQVSQRLQAKIPKT